MPHDGIDEIEAQEDADNRSRAADALARLEKANKAGPDQTATQKVDKLIDELWHTGMALSVIAHWKVWTIPFLSHFNRYYVVAWVIRTAQILVSFGRVDLAADMVIAKGARQNVTVPVLLQARSIILHNQDDPSYIRKRLSELEITQ